MKKSNNKKDIILSDSAGEAEELSSLFVHKLDSAGQIKSVHSTTFGTKVLLKDEHEFYFSDISHLDVLLKKEKGWSICRSLCMSDALIAFDANPYSDGYKDSLHFSGRSSLRMFGLKTKREYLEEIGREAEYFVICRSVSSAIVLARKFSNLLYRTGELKKIIGRLVIVTTQNDRYQFISERGSKHILEGRPNVTILHERYFDSMMNSYQPTIRRLMIGKIKIIYHRTIENFNRIFLHK